MNITPYFQRAIKEKASDLHLIAGEPPVLRIRSVLKIIKEPPLNSTDLQKSLFALLNDEQRQRFDKEKELDIAYQIPEGRFRVNIHWQKRQIAAAARAIPDVIPKPEAIGLTEHLYNLTHLNQGLILVTGPSGQGKSTTLAVMIDIINQERRSHIITIEDPIEFVYKRKQSVIEQREVGIDTHSFDIALKYALRQDPNVILVGEMRDLETVRTALIAAETGHLVLSTLHTPNAAETVERIISLFPAEQQRQILIQFAATLRAVISQQLIPQKDGRLVAAREIMINNSAIANLIREHKIAQIPSVIQTSRKEGMITMTMAMKKLLDDGLIDEDTAKNRIGTFETLATYY